MATNYPFPMPQPSAQIIDPSTGRWTQVGYKWSLSMWGRTGGPVGSNSADVLQSANNLSDVGSKAQSRTNLGLGTAATQNVGAFLQTANNLGDLANPAAARTNLGLGDAATHPASDFATAAQGALAASALQPGTDISVTHVLIGGNTVLGPRIAGWGTPSGGVRGSGVAYAGQTVGATYSQTQAQATDDAVKAVSQKLTALIADLQTQGLIGT